MISEFIEAFLQGFRQTSVYTILLWPIINCLDSFWQAFKSSFAGGDNETQENAEY